MNNSVDEILFRNVLVHEVLGKEINEIFEINSSQKSDISPETGETSVIENELIEDKILLLRNAAFSSDNEINESDLTNLAALTLNLAEDPNMQDMVPEYESPTAKKKLMR